jgi:hypothetical protein
MLDAALAIVHHPLVLAIAAVPAAEPALVGTT